MVRRYCHLLEGFNIETAIEKVLRTHDPESSGAQKFTQAPEKAKGGGNYVPPQHLTGVESLISVRIPVGDEVADFFKLFRDHSSNYIDSREGKTVNELDDEAVLRELGL